MDSVGDTLPDEEEVVVAETPALAAGAASDLLGRAM
jgi:hypothetical protein